MRYNSDLSDNSDLVAALLKELLSLNRAEDASKAHPPASEEELEQRQSKRTRIRQELVLTLSLRGL
jgi:hypothetical protein